MTAVTSSNNDLPAWQRLANYMQRGDTIGAEVSVRGDGEIITLEILCAHMRIPIHIIFRL